MAGTKGVTIGHADRRDLGELIEIYSSKELHHNSKDADWFVNCYFDYHHILLAKEGNKIVGASFWRVMGEKVYGAAWIDNLWVEPKHRRTGIGELLLIGSIEDVMRFFSEQGVIGRRLVLTTPEASENARGLYEKAGFELVSNLGDIYEKDDDELMYVLDLEHR